LSTHSTELCCKQKRNRLPVLLTNVPASTISTPVPKSGCTSFCRSSFLSIVRFARRVFSFRHPNGCPHFPDRSIVDEAAHSAEAARLTSTSSGHGRLPSLSFRIARVNRRGVMGCVSTGRPWIPLQSVFLCAMKTSKTRSAKGLSTARPKRMTVNAVVLAALESHSCGNMCRADV